MGLSFYVIPVAGAASGFPLIPQVSFSRISWFSVSQKKTDLLEDYGEDRPEGEQGQKEGWFYEKSSAT